MTTIAELLAAAEPSAPRRLGELVERLATDGHLRGARDGGQAIGPAALGDVAVTGVAYDSRDVRPGSLFVAVPGAHVDGHDYLAAAARSGASVALVERPVAEVELPQLVVIRTQHALATAAAWWYGDPSHRLGVVGITGTDGKTTTSLPGRAGPRGRRHLDGSAGHRRDQDRRRTRARTPST